MNLVDLVVVAVVAISGLLGLSRGFVRETLGLGSWLLAGYGALRLGPELIPFARRAIGNPDISDPAAYVITFIVLVIALSLLANLVGRLVRVSALGGVDRILGLVFGIARGAAVLIAAYILGGVAMSHTENWPPQLQTARTMPLLYDGALWVIGLLPTIYRPAIPAPPDGHSPPAAADPSHATPEVHALGPEPGITR